MFSGIVAELGSVEATEETGAGRRLRISAPLTVEGLAIGDSVAVNGVCLTAVEVTTSSFVLDVVDESLDRSNLGALAVGDPVDLERPLSSSGRFDGHIVQGHVDGVGTVAFVTMEGDAKRLRVAAPVGLARYLVEKGSVTVDGVSLTITAVAALSDPTFWFEVVLIPHTLTVTVLGRRAEGDPVNLEVDVIAKYVERLLEARA